MTNPPITQQTIVLVNSNRLTINLITHAQSGQPVKYSMEVLDRTNEPFTHACPDMTQEQLQGLATSISGYFSQPHQSITSKEVAVEGERVDFAELARLDREVKEKNEPVSTES